MEGAWQVWTGKVEEANRRPRPPRLHPYLQPFILLYPLLFPPFIPPSPARRDGQVVLKVVIDHIHQRLPHRVEVLLLSLFE